MSNKHSLEQIVNVSKELFKSCSLNSANVERTDGNKLVVNTDWSQIDLEKNERIKFQRTYLFELNETNNAQLIHVTKPQSLRNEIWSVKSPDNLRNAVLTSWKDNNEDKQFIEIWNNETRLESINLAKLDKHGKVYENSECLGSFVWSSDSTKLAYIAEAKQTAKEKSFFTSKIETSETITSSATSLSNDEDKEKSKEQLLNENNFEKKYGNYFVDEWGELYVGKSQSVISIFDLDSLEVKVLENIPEDYVPGQMSWFRNEGLIFSAYYTKPYKLGLVYCPIRKSELFYYDLTSNTCTQITDYKNECLRDPRFSNDYESVCWLQNQARGPHFQCTKLMMMNWKTRETSTIVDIVNDSKDDEFPGLFSIKFPNNCWSLDNKRILINTKWRRVNRIACIDVENKTITALDNKLDPLNSCESLKISNDWICANLQGYNRRPFLIIGKLPDRGNESNINWILTQTKDSLIDVADVELLKFNPTIPDPTYPNVYFEAILVQPKVRNDTLIVFPHGGPHSAYCCEFSSHVAIFYSLGYSTLMINYRGSCAYGQDNINSLPGKIGTSDVNDVQQSAEFTMNKYNFKNAVLYGGSHGGFLITHLIGQFPNFYKAASARNAVTHLESMLSITDISDWVFCEGLGNYDFDYRCVGNPEIYNELYKRSPIRYIDNVKTPTILMIGCVDLRVPPSQGYEYYKALISRNVPAKALVFKEDSHPLDKPQTNADCVVSTLLWYEKYLN